MKNNDEILKDSENQYRRMALQAEQEKAMAAVFPIRFEKNICAFEKYIPSVALEFRSYKAKNNIEFFCTENGQPNIKWINDSALYGKEPYSECEQQIITLLRDGDLSKITLGIQDNPLGFPHVKYLNEMSSSISLAIENREVNTKVVEYIPSLVMFGVGLGYQIGYLYERCHVGMLFIVEPEADLFYASLYSFDWATLLEHIFSNGMGVHIFIGQDESNIIADFNQVIQKRGGFLVSNLMPYWHYPSEKMYKLIKKMMDEKHLLTIGWGFFDDNVLALSHSFANINSDAHFLLKANEVNNQLLSKVPVFIIANGPSLDIAIDFILENRESAIVVSCGSVLTALHRYGLKPDIHVETERTHLTYDFMKLIDDDAYFDDILFLSSDVIHPDCLTLFNRSVLCFKQEEPSYHLYYSRHYKFFSNFQASSGLNPLVANIGLTLACRIGFREIYLFGTDCGYKSKEHHHSKKSAYYHNNDAKEKIESLIYTSGNIIREGNFGGDVISDQFYDACRRVMESALGTFKNVECYNCSDGVKIDGAIPLRVEDICLHGRVDKAFFVDVIYNNLSAPITLPNQDVIRKSLGVDFFVDTLSQMKAGWMSVDRNKKSVSELMLQHYGYVTGLSNTDMMHVYRMLAGTLNYVFTCISTAAFCLEDESETAILLNKIIDVFVGYIDYMIDTYPHAFDRIDEYDNSSVMELFIKK